jgi:hypothetical protein
MALNKILLLVLLTFFTACKSQQGNKEISATKLSQRMEQKLGKELTSVNNFDNTYVLSWGEDSSDGTLVLRYGVWIIKTGELLYAGTAISGKVEWLNNTSLLLEEYPGIIDEDNPNYKFKIDLITKIKMPLHDEKDL